MPLALFWRWLIQGQVLYLGAVFFQFWPWYTLVRRSLLAGEWPLWNPWLGSGAPLLANLQSAVFYPPTLLSLALPAEQTITLSVAGHLALAGLLMYGYARRLGLSGFAALLSGLTFMLSGYLTGRTQFPPMVSAAAWLPLLLWLGEKLARRPQPAAGVWLAVGLALPLLAGHAQLWFYSLCLLTAYLLLRRLQVAGWRGLWPVIITLTAAVAAALLLAAVQILPTAEYLLRSPRGTGAERHFALSYSFWPWRLITLAAPDFFGHPARQNYWGYANYWEDHAYMGLLPLVLVGLALFRRFGRHPGDLPRPVWQVIPIFGALIPVSILLAMGWNTPVYLWVFDHVPGFGYFQAPARLLIWYTVAVAVLTGAGAEMLTRRPPGPAVWRVILTAALGMLIAGLAGRFWLAGRGYIFAGAAIRLAVWLGLSMVALLVRPSADRPPAWRTAWQWGLAGLVAVDLLLVAWPVVPTRSPDIFHRPPETVEQVRRHSNGRIYMDPELAYRLKFDHFFRFDRFLPPDSPAWNDLPATLLPNLPAVYGLASLNNDDPLVVGHQQKLVDLLRQADDGTARRLLQMAGVEVAVLPPERRLGRPLWENALVSIQRLAPAPRAYFVPVAVLAGDEDSAAARLVAPDFDYRAEVIIIKPPDLLPENQPADAAVMPVQAEVTVTSPGPDEVIVQVDAPRSGYLVLTDTCYPGWRAEIDGRAVPILQANLAFRAVPVPAGRHQVVFRYQPASFTAGMVVSLATALALVAALVAAVRRAKRGK